jgi:hypothetical protein
LRERGDLVGYGVQHRAGRGAFKGQDVELHQVVDVDVALPNAARSNGLNAVTAGPIFALMAQNAAGPASRDVTLEDVKVGSANRRL